MPNKKTTTKNKYPDPTLRVPTGSVVRPLTDYCTPVNSGGDDGCCDDPDADHMQGTLTDTANMVCKDIGQCHDLLDEIFATVDGPCPGQSNDPKCSGPDSLATVLGDSLKSVHLLIDRLARLRNRL